MKVLGRWATVGFAVLAVVLSAVIAAVTTVEAMRIMMPAKAPARFDGTTAAVFGLVWYSVLLITLMLASRLSGPNVLAYLGLDIPRLRHIAITVIGLAVWTVFVDALDFVLDKNTMSPWMLAIYRSAPADGSLIWLWLAIVVAAPIGEELLFRGFMFRGFVHAPRDAVPSIVLISLLWSLAHTQYDWFTIKEIFVLGVLYGLVRWSTGSTTLTIILHTLNNLGAFMIMEFALG
jgi:membrane protease YdiL (CAAX protease family)